MNQFCPFCGNPATRLVRGNAGYCDQHARFLQMRHGAAVGGKFAPPIFQLEQMVPAGMKCPTCTRQMNWYTRDGWSTVAVLQHDRNGSVRIICQGCNVRHGHMPGDSFFELPKGHKLCRNCEFIKPLNEFNLRQSRCRLCTSAIDAIRIARDPQKWRDDAREAMRRWRVKQKTTKSEGL